MSRLAVSCAALLGATALVAACSVYDESLLGAGGVDDTSSSKSGKGNGGETGDGGAGPTTGTESTTGTEATTGTESTSVASTGQTGTVTTGSECETPDDCPGQDSECAQRSCEGNTCSVINKESGFVLGRQTEGDCLVQVCDGQGSIVSDVDDADLPLQTDDCVNPVCTNGVLGSENAEPRDPCGSSFLCDGTGECVECLDDTDCDDNCSDTQECVAAQCDDGDQNGVETDVDYGGGTCSDCQNGDTCAVNGDCVSNSCDVVCMPSCTDGVLGPNEADVDCGGACPALCTLGSDCGVGGDCGSGFCLADACTPALFISEYVEGAGQNKALEIFNYGNEAVDLNVVAANCSVSVYQNGSMAPANGSPINLTGTIEGFGVWVIAKSGGSPAPSPTLIALADQTSGSLVFNGDDAVSLQCGGAVLDVFGEIGDFPEDVGWGSGLTNTLNHTLRRGGGIDEGDRNGADAFNPAPPQWEGFAIDTFTGLGDHP